MVAIQEVKSGLTQKKVKKGGGEVVDRVSISSFITIAVVLVFYIAFQTNDCECH